MIDASLAQKILQSEEGFMVAPPGRRKNHLLEMFHLFPEPPKWFKLKFKVWTMECWEKDIEKVLKTVNQLAKFTYFSPPAKLAAMMHKSWKVARKVERSTVEQM